jgi:hypothetical protein
MRALMYIINADLNDEIMALKFTNEDKIIAKIVYDGIMNFPEKNKKHFRIHTKGVGIFCNNLATSNIQTNPLPLSFVPVPFNES